MPIHGPLVLSRAPHEVERGRAFVGAACRDHSRELSNTAALLASELLTNAVLHGGSGPIALSVTVSERRIRVDVTDQSKHYPRRGDVDAGGVSGRGLLMVESLSAAWGVLPDMIGKTVWFTLRTG